METAKKKKQEGYCAIFISPKKNRKDIVPFLSRLYKSIGSFCCHFDVGAGMGGTLESFTSKIFSTMGKALSGELSCTGTSLVVSRV